MDAGVQPPQTQTQTQTQNQNGHGANRILNHSVLGPMSEAKTVTFSFDGVEVIAREGEAVAAALLATGFRVLRTMPESGEPRGGYCMVGRCSDCQVVVDGVAGVASCVTSVRSGIVVQTQFGVGREVLGEFMDGAE